MKNISCDPSYFQLWKKPTFYGIFTKKCDYSLICNSLDTIFDLMKNTFYMK